MGALLTGEEDAVGTGTGLAAEPTFKNLVGLSALAEDCRLDWGTCGGSGCTSGARRFAGMTWVGAGAGAGEGL